MGILKREPVLTLSLIAAIIQLGSATLLHLSVDQQGVLNAVAVAVMGLVAAWHVSGGAAAAALSGLAKAVLALALAFGVHLSADLQSSAMVFVSAATAFWLRTQVVASDA